MDDNTKMMNEEASAPISPNVAREPTVCESCGAEFGCGARAEGCWCAELELSEETRASLRSRFKGCLCRACLERFATSIDARSR